MSQKVLKFQNSLNYRMGHQDQIDFYQQQMECQVQDIIKISSLYQMLENIQCPNM